MTHHTGVLRSLLGVFLRAVGSQETNSNFRGSAALPITRLAPPLSRVRLLSLRSWNYRACQTVQWRL
jgi:hypothetical protein